MDPITLFLISTAVSGGSDFVTSMLENNSLNKDRKQRAEELAKAHALQQESITRQIGLARKNRMITDRDAQDELTNLSFVNTRNDFNKSQLARATTFRGN